MLKMLSIKSISTFPITHRFVSGGHCSTAVQSKLHGKSRRVPALMIVFGGVKSCHYCSICCSTQGNSERPTPLLPTTLHYLPFILLLSKQIHFLFHTVHTLSHNHNHGPLNTRLHHLRCPYPNGHVPGLSRQPDRRPARCTRDQERRLSRRCQA